MKPYYDNGGITIYCGDCLEVMPTLDDKMIDLTVTSPPYDNLRDYNGYTFDFEGIAQGLWRLTKQGGVVVWVVGDATVDGSETLTSFKQAIRFNEIGFNAHDTMIYEKASVSFPETTRYYPAFEYMFVLSKGHPKTISLLKDRRNNWAGQTVHSTMRNRDGTLSPKSCIGNITEEYGVRYNIWRIPHNKPGRASHPASFPEALPRDHITSWSNEGDIVFDPMLGSGTTLKMAQALGRRAIGIEVSEDYCQIAVERLRQPSFFSIPSQQPAQPEYQQASLIDGSDD